MIAASAMVSRPPSERPSGGASASSPGGNGGGVLEVLGIRAHVVEVIDHQQHPMAALANAIGARGKRVDALGDGIEILQLAGGAIKC